MVYASAFCPSDQKIELKAMGFVGKIKINHVKV